MEGKRSKSCSNMEVEELDRISNLPNEIMGKILSSLPMKEGARTSVLSSNWRYKWAMVPDLVFGPFCPSNIVDNVLLSHIGPISKFHIFRYKNYEDVDRWIFPISRHPIKELKLEFQAWGEEPYKLPFCIFSCQKLIHLHLTICLLKPPPTFNGFRSLKSLYFDHVTIAQDVLEHMIVCCHLLERLTLQYCKGFRQLKIDAPLLQYLFYESSLDFFLDDLSFVNTPNLAVVGILYLHQLDSYGSCNLLKFFSDLPKIQRLHISGRLLNFMAGGAFLEELPKPCLHLKSLRTDISFRVVEHVSNLICLMRSSPALETLNIHQKPYYHDVEAGNSWLDKYRSCSFTKLRAVEIKDIAGVKAELNFIRFLLVSSPVLQTMTVVFNTPKTYYVGSPGPDDETLNVYLECEDQARAEAVNYWLDKNWSYSFTQLRHVKIQGKFDEAEINFIRFLLISSPVLETMTILIQLPWPDSYEGNSHPEYLQFSLDVVKKLLSFRRASPNVEIICLEAERLDFYGEVYEGP